MSQFADIPTLYKGIKFHKFSDKTLSHTLECRIVAVTDSRDIADVIIAADAINVFEDCHVQA